MEHSQLETSLIYARATTDMKRKAVDKISAKENSVFKSDEKFKYADNEDVIRQLYGLMWFEMPIFIWIPHLFQVLPNDIGIIQVNGNIRSSALLHGAPSLWKQYSTALQIEQAFA